MRLFSVAHPGLAKLAPRRGWIEAVQLPPGDYVPPRTTRPTQLRSPTGAATAASDGLVGKAGGLLAKSASLVKKTYREAKGETVVDDEEKVQTFTAHHVAVRVRPPSRSQPQSTAGCQTPLRRCCR